MAFSQPSALAPPLRLPAAMSMPVAAATTAHFPAPAESLPAAKRPNIASNLSLLPETSSPFASTASSSSSSSSSAAAAAVASATSALTQLPIPPISQMDSGLAARMSAAAAVQAVVAQGAAGTASAPPRRLPNAVASGDDPPTIPRFIGLNVQQVLLHWYQQLRASLDTPCPTCPTAA